MLRPRCTAGRASPRASQAATVQLSVPILAALGGSLLLGEEGRVETVAADQKVVADRLVASGYEMRDPELEGALRHILGR